MRGRVELHLEDAKGRPVEGSPSWQAEERQFLWEVVHDTRGFLRRTVPAEDVAVIRTLDDQGGRGGPGLAVDAAKALMAYERARTALREHAEEGPHFHWLAREGSEEWAAVQHFETDGEVRTVVGGWSPPVVRGGPEGDEPERTVSPGQDEVEVAGAVLRIRRQPFYELFAEDLGRLIEVLRDAADRGLRARFVQR